VTASLLLQSEYRPGSLNFFSCVRPGTPDNATFVLPFPALPFDCRNSGVPWSVCSRVDMTSPPCVSDCRSSFFCSLRTSCEHSFFFEISPCSAYAHDVPRIIVWLSPPSPFLTFFFPTTLAANIHLPPPLCPLFSGRFLFLPDLRERGVLSTK